VIEADHTTEHFQIDDLLQICVMGGRKVLLHAMPHLPSNQSESKVIDICKHQDQNAANGQSLFQTSVFPLWCSIKRLSQQGGHGAVGVHLGACR
jgi:hypothetical protein